MNRYFAICSILLVICLAHLVSVSAHGRLMDPVARGSRWRLNSSAPADYDDNQGWCGGYTVQWDHNKGKCGLCGNTYTDKTPRQHELGGKYGEGVIVKTYKTGSQITVNVDLTANHWGHFVFDICNIDLDGQESEQCFAKYKLKLSTGEDRYALESKTPGAFKVALKLPGDLNCKHCVLRWTYSAANRWGMCEDGTGKLGCGPQETFVGCSDISISQNLIIENEMVDENESNEEADNLIVDQLTEAMESLEELLNNLSNESDE